MRRFLTIATAITAMAFTAGVGAKQLPLGGGKPERNDPSFPQQGVMEGPGHKVGDTAQGANLADTLTLDRKGGLWWDYARDISATARLLSTGGKQTTLLVPVDSAIMRMSRKPHQDADGSTPDDDAATENVARFVAAHVVPGDLDLPTEASVKTMLDGFDVSIEKSGEDYKVQPGDIKVLSVKNASNGKILYLDSVIDYPLKA